MTTEILGTQFQYTNTIGRMAFFGPGFRYPIAMARGEGDLLYVVNRGEDARPDSKRVTVCTVTEEYITQFAQGVTTIGVVESSSADGSLIWPTSIALDKDDNLYIADEWLNRISVFTKDGDWIGKWGTPGDGEGQINCPSGLAFDGEENLLVVDSRNHRVQRFTKDGKCLGAWGRLGSGDGEFNMPWGINIDTNGDVYVADWRNERIQKFGPDGRFLMKFGSPGTGDGEFNRPTGVAVDNDGIIYVADKGNNRVQVFDPDGSLIAQMRGDATLSKWGTAQLDSNAEMWKEREIAYGLEREKLFRTPVAVEVDDQGRIFIAELGRHRIQVYRKQHPIFSADHL